MILQPITNILNTLFSIPDRELMPEGLTPIKGTSFMIDRQLYTKVLVAKDIVGAEHEAETIRRQLETHCANTVEVQ